MTIRKLKQGFRVVSKSGKNLGKFDTKKEAQQRLKEIEHFKKVGKKLK
jgi:hypothetical protein